MTQEELGVSIGVNRSQVNRIERGNAEVTRSLAERLAVALDLPDLPRLYSERESADLDLDVSRDKVVERLLRLPDLQAITIVVADDLDVYRLVYDSATDTPLVDAQQVDVVFPTVGRERELFGGQPIYGHVEYQIKRLAALRGGDSQPWGLLRLFESAAVMGSAVVARTRTGTSGAFWAPLAVAGRVVTASLPVASGSDPTTAGLLEGHIDGLMDRARPIHVNEALCRVGPVECDTHGEAAFTRYFEVGEDEEDEVGENEGFALALVLAVARCPRKQHGVARRLITYQRPTARHDRKRLSLFSNQVDATDVREARARERGTPPDEARSRGNALEAALDTDDYLTAHGGEIPDLAYQIAAARELRMFALEVDHDRLERVELPPELRLIAKSGVRRAALAPRLFVLELGSVDGRPELDVLAAGADTEALGSDDLQSEDARLNDFLRHARDCGLLVPLLQKLGVAPR